MRKFLLLLGIAVLSSYGISAQNNMRAFEYDNGDLETLPVFPDYQIRKIDDHSWVRYKEINNSPSSTRANYTLTINVKGNYSMGMIGDGADYMDFLMPMGDQIVLTVPEGVFDIFLEGSAHEEGNYVYNFLSLNQIEVYEDTEIEADFATCVHKLHWDVVDQNGTPVSELEFADLSIQIELWMHPSIGLGAGHGLSCYDEGWENVTYYFNDFSERNRVFAALKFLTRKGDDYAAGENYYIAYNFYDGIYENIPLSNTPEDLINHKQFFNIGENTPHDSYSDLATIDVNYYDGGFTSPMYTLGAFNPLRKHDRSKPYSLYTNTTYNENPKNGEKNTFLRPVFYESVDLDAENPSYTTRIISDPIIVNTENKVYTNCFGHLNYSLIYKTENWNNLLRGNPLAKFYEHGETIYNSYRTPHLLYLPYCYNQSNSPTGSATISGGCLYLGGHNEQREVDADILINVEVDGIQVFSDNLYKFNMNKLEIAPEAASATMTILNDKVKAYGKTMINYSEVEIDLSKEDAMPPALTVLRVLDENDKISIDIKNPKDSKLEIAAGDYAYDGTAKIMKYVGKPDIEIYCMIGDLAEEFYLDAVEDPSRFHTAYGNVFEVSLAPLADIEFPLTEMEEWITVVVVLSDEAGNKISQTFDPLFYCGNLMSIPTLEKSVKHTVFPNPFMEEITVSLEKPLQGETYFEVYDMLGRVIHQQKINCDQTTTFRWDGSHVKSGVYFYGIYNNGNAVKGKMVKP